MSVIPPTEESPLAPEPTIVMFDLFRVTLTPGSPQATLRIENVGDDELIGIGITCAGLGGLSVSLQTTKIARLRAHASWETELQLSGPMRPQMRLKIAYRRAGGGAPLQVETVLEIALPPPITSEQLKNEQIQNRKHQPKSDKTTDIKLRRLLALEQQAALYGPGTDPAILIQIEDLKQELGIDD